MAAERTPSGSSMPHAGARLGRSILGVSIVLGIAAVTLGATRWGTPWAPVATGAGGLVIVAAGCGFIFDRWRAALGSVLAIAAAGLIVTGAIVPDVTMIAVGILGLIVIGAAVLDVPPDPSPVPFRDAESEISELLHQIHEHTMLSDGAKRVLFRERELNLLRDAIEVDIAEQKYDVALTLCDEMADVFGYREDAEVFRSRIIQARQARFDRDVHGALDDFNVLLAERDWGRVHQEAARIRRLFGESHLVQDLDRRIMQAREDHRQELEANFLHAAERDDVEGAMSLLKQLDRYLDEEGVARLSDVAQGIVARHRDNLGLQFKLAVQDKRWGEAVGIGEDIVREFPNTKMAEEVREMLSRIKERAAQTTLSDFKTTDISPMR